MDVVIRDAKKSDCEAIAELIKELAIFENMPDGPKISYEDLERDGFETEPPLFKAIVAVKSESVIGHALYYYTYSSWEGKSMFLDDFYLSPTYRSLGIGGRMFDMVAKKAFDENCSRLEFSVLSWNPASQMYEKKGANDLTKREKWHLFRMNRESLKKYENFE